MKKALALLLVVSLLVGCSAEGQTGFSLINGAALIFVILFAGIIAAQMFSKRADDDK